MSDEPSDLMRAADHPLPFALKAAAILMIGGAIWKIVSLLVSASQPNSMIYAFAGCWGIIGVCGLGVLLRSDMARIAGCVLLNLMAVLYFVGLAVFVIAIFFASMGNNQPGSAAGQFLSLLFTPLIALVCAKVLFGAGQIARPKADGLTPAP